MRPPTSCSEWVAVPSVGFPSTKPLIVQGENGFWETLTPRLSRCSWGTAGTARDHLAMVELKVQDASPNSFANFDRRNAKRISVPSAATSLNRGSR